MLAKSIHKCAIAWINFSIFLILLHRVAGNAAYILGTIAESELGCFRVISLTTGKNNESSKILSDLTNMLAFDDSESVMNAAGTMGTLVRKHYHS